MTKLEKIQYKLEQVYLFPKVCKFLMIFKALVIKCIVAFNKMPKYKVIYKPKSPTLDELEKKFKSELIVEDGIYYYATGKDFVDIGDMCLHNGLYTGYEIKSGNLEQFSTYVDTFLVESMSKGVYTLLRGVNLKNNEIRDDASGDQLMGLVYAISEFKINVAFKELNIKTNSTFLKLGKFTDEFIKNNYTLLNSEGIPTQFGFFGPNIFAVNGRCAVVLAFLAVMERWNEFFILYYNYGYKYALDIPSVYIYNDSIKWRAWFSDNVNMLALSVIYKNCPFKKDINSIRVRIQIRNAMYNILTSNSWNLFYYMLAKDAGMYILPSKESISYFNTFKITLSKISIFYSLGSQNADFVWQRNPFKHEINVGKKYGKIDYLLTKLLSDKHKIDLNNY